MMINKITKSLIMFLGVILLISCAAQDDILYLNNQLKTIQKQLKTDSQKTEEMRGDLGSGLESIENKMSELERSLKEEQESLRLSFANIAAETDALKDGMRKLHGRVDENSHMLKDVVEKDTSKEDFLASETRNLLKAVEDLRAKINKIEGQVTALASEKKKGAAEKEVSFASEEKETKEPPSSQRVLSEKERYDNTLVYFKDGLYEKCIEGFKEFLKLYPKSNLADNANFWIGECHKSLKNYEEAILAYQKVINGYPKGNKVPSAMLQQAFAFEKINDVTTANLLFKKLVKHFPKSKEADIARKRLQ